MTDNRNNIKTTAFRLLMLLFILTFVTGVQAQKYSLGVKGGASLTWPSFGDSEARDVFNRRLKPGFTAAILVGFPLKNNYDLYLEGGVSQKGRILTFNPGNSWQNNLTMQMVDMSMMLRRSFRFMLKKNTPSEGFINLGPEISYWMGSRGYIQVEDGKKYKYTVLFDEEFPASPTEYYVNIEDANRWLFSLGIGVGLRAPLAPNRFLTTELRFSSGHTFLGRPDAATLNRIFFDLQDTMKTNLKTVSLTFAYSIGIDVKESRKGKSTIKKKLKR